MGLSTFIAQVLIWPSSIEHLFQILMLKSRCHPVDLVLGDALPGRFVPPFRGGFADLGSYVTRLDVIQLKISGHLHGQGQRSGGVLFVDGRGQDAGFHIDRHRVEIIGR